MYELTIHVIMIASCVTKAFKPSTASGTDQPKEKKKITSSVNTYNFLLVYKNNQQYG